jgi:tRNA G18 (ribose-2'-O)-methylase SpoU
MFLKLFETSCSALAQIRCIFVLMPFQRKTMPELEALSNSLAETIKPMRVCVLLDDVRSMQNVGSIFRSADAMGVEKIILSGYTPRPPHRDIQKTALGATETVAWEGVEDAVACLGALKNEGYHIVAVEQTHRSTPLHRFLPEPGRGYVLVMGNEVDGVQDAVLDLCDTVLEIPQVGAKHSLNVSVTAGVVLWELARYRFNDLNHNLD